MSTIVATEHRDIDALHVWIQGPLVRFGVSLGKGGGHVFGVCTSVGRFPEGAKQRAIAVATRWAREHGFSHYVS